MLLTIAKWETWSIHQLKNVIRVVYAHNRILFHNKKEWGTANRDSMDDLENVMLSARSQSQNNTHSMISFYEMSRRGKIHYHRRGGLPRAGGDGLGRNGEWLWMDTGFLRGWWSYSKIVLMASQLWIRQIPLITLFKWVELYVMWVISQINLFLKKKKKSEEKYDIILSRPLISDHPAPLG